jgi:hypothetical protein
MNLNEELVKTRCQKIEESLERLERIKGKPKEEFLRDQDLKDIACYRLLVAIPHLPQTILVPLYFTILSEET